MQSFFHQLQLIFKCFQSFSASFDCFKQFSVVGRQKLNEQLNVTRRARFSNGPFSMIFGRTDLWISQSRPKFDEEADFEVRSALDPQKACPFGEIRNFRSEIFAEKFFWRRKVKHRESSETRFRKVSWRQNEKIRTLPSDANGHF